MPKGVKLNNFDDISSYRSLLDRIGDPDRLSTRLQTFNVIDITK